MKETPAFLQNQTTKKNSSQPSQRLTFQKEAQLSQNQPIKSLRTARSAEQKISRRVTQCIALFVNLLNPLSLRRD